MMLGSQNSPESSDLNGLISSLREGAECPPSEERFIELPCVSGSVGGVMRHGTRASRRPSLPITSGRLVQSETGCGYFSARCPGLMSILAALVMVSEAGGIELRRPKAPLFGCPPVRPWFWAGAYRVWPPLDRIMGYQTLPKTQL
jgi:hypothetical protein